MEYNHVENALFGRLDQQSFIMTAGVRQPWSLSALWGASSSVLHYPTIKLKKKKPKVHRHKLTSVNAAFQHD